MSKKNISTSWEPAENWYNSCVGEKGHYYHQSVILPSTLRLLQIKAKSTGALLDVGCGQGVLERQIPDGIEYWGVDASASLIKNAKKQTQKPNRHFLVGDATQPLPVDKTDFDWATFILCLQNMEDGKAAIAGVSRHLKKGGKLLLVLNHPCFRIPRQSAWGVDEAAKLQYRRLNTYMSPMKIPIQMNPGKGEQSSTTYSFHHSLTDYMSWLAAAGFSVSALEEWCSDKKSEGGRARMEDRARKEFPLFLALLCVKNL
ncbi:MAG: class I SAM-dependent methyltransferase [Verrucomicrobia bacterium]|nr:class I SAM-dependent methyltransferase [Verrucomicrobiota bacterium]